MAQPDVLDAAIAAAAIYYDLPTGEVEYCANFLRTFATLKEPHKWFLPVLVVPRIIEQVVNDLYFLPTSVRRRAITLRDPTTRICRSTLKIEELMNLFPNSSHVIDLSCAPGGWTKWLLDNGYSVRPYHYIGEGALELSKYIHSHPYQDIDDCHFDLEGADLILSDAAPNMDADDRAVAVLSLLEKIKRVICSKEISYVVKINCPNHPAVQTLVNSFPRKTRLIRSANSTLLSNELYLIGNATTDYELDWRPLAESLDDKYALPSVHVGDLSFQPGGEYKGRMDVNHIFSMTGEYFYFRLEEGPPIYLSDGNKYQKICMGNTKPVTIIDYTVNLRNVICGSIENGETTKEPAGNTPPMEQCIQEDTH
nr:MAG: non-structural polyprotein [Avian associated hepe-like virus 22]